MSAKPNCMKGSTPLDGDLKTFFNLINLKSIKEIISGIINYQFDKIICPTLATLVIGEDTEQTLFHLLSKKWTATLIIKAVPNVNELINKFVENLHVIIVTENNSDVIDKIKNTTVLEEPFLDFKGRKINRWGNWIVDEKSLSAKDTASENAKDETNENIKDRLLKMVDIIDHIEKQKVETKPRSDSTASTASMKTVSSTESLQVDEELENLRKEYEYAEKNLKTSINAGDCRKLKKYIDTINNDIDKYKKRKSFFNSCGTEDKLINILMPKLEKRTSEYNKFDCQPKLNGGKRQTSKKQRKTRKTKKSKRATKKH